LGRHSFRVSFFFVFKLMAFLLFAVNSAATSSQHYVFNRADFPTGNRPSGVAVADVNGDGIQDLIVTNQSDNTVSIFLGQPNGTFGAKTDFATGVSPYSVVVGDFNKDGKVDLAVTDSCGSNCGSVSILLGNGDGTFQPHVEYATGVNPFEMVAADFNGDGKLDLAIVDTCGQGCGFVSILLGNGDGTFQAKVDYAVGQSPTAIVAQDFNGDGNLDLAVTNTSNSISILLGKGDGTFQPAVNYPSSGSPWGIAAADFNGDKIIDLAVTHSAGLWALTILKGNGDGTFQAEQQVPSNLPGGFASEKIVALDLNADGKQDLILTDVSEGGALVLLGNGDGTFQPPVNYASGSYPFAFAAKDVNGDGNIDLEIADQESNYITVLLGNGDGTFSPRTNVPPGPSTPVQLYPVAGVIGDFNGDGIPDLLVSEGSSDYTIYGGLSVLLGKGKGAFQAPINTNSNGASGSIAAADFNGDGRLDIALSNGDGAAVMLGNGDGTFGAPIQVLNTLASPARGLVAGDFNNDGKQDLVVVANGFLQTFPIYVFLGNGDGTFQLPREFWSSTSIPTLIASGDFNRDGILDLVVILNPNGIAVMLGSGDGTFRSPVIYPTDDLPSGLTVADVNGDGIPDIVAIGNQVDVYLGKGDGTFAAPVYYSAGNFPQQVITGDFNADGKVDIAVTAEGTAASGGLEILLGNGDGTFQPPIEIADGAPVGAPMAVGDLNQDGTSDVFIAGGNGALFLSGPIATLSPASLNLGSVTVGSTSTPLDLTVANSGNAPLELGSVTTTTSYAVTNGCGDSVGLRTTCALNVTFAPVASGASLGVLTLTDNAPRNVQMVALSGTGLADFSLSIPSGSSNSATVAAGNSVSYTLIVAPVAGFSQSVTFTCTGAPAAATCTVSPSSPTLDGTNPVTLTVQVSTVARAAGTGAPFVFPPLGAPSFLSSFIALMLFGLVLVLLNRMSAGGKLPTRPFTLVFFCAILLGISACGGSGGGSGGGGGGGSSGTPAGTYTLTVTGSSGTGAASLQHSLKLTLTVN